MTEKDIVKNEYGIEIISDEFISRIYAVSTGFDLRPHEKDLVNTFTRAVWIIGVEQKQAEIDALRKELEQVKMREVVYIDLLRKASESIGDFVSDHGWTMVDMNTLDAIDASLSATSEQIEAYRAEIIAQAKKEQRSSDYWRVESLPTNADRFEILEAIRNNKE